MQEGVYCKEGAALDVVADVHTPVPGGTGTFTSAFAGEQETNGGDVALISREVEHFGVYAEINGDLGLVANGNTPIPGGQGDFVSSGLGVAFEGVSISGAQVAFGGRGVDQEGIYSTIGGGLRVEADRNTILPGVAGKASGLRMPTVDRGSVSFHASGQFGAGVYARIGNSIEVVADTATQVPGRTEAFSLIDIWNATERHNVAFWGRCMVNGVAVDGVYVRYYDTLFKIIDSEDTIDGRDVGAVSIGPHAISGNRVAFKVTFADFSQGLYVAILPVIFEDGFESGNLVMWSAAH